MKKMIKNVCIPILWKDRTRKYFIADFCMELYIVSQSALALPVFLNFMLEAYESNQVEKMYLYATIWFVISVLFLVLRYQFDLLVNGKFYYETLSEVREQCINKIYGDNDIQIDRDFDGNQLYSFLAIEIETFVNMMFRMNRIFAVSLVLLIFSIWAMTVGGRLTLIVILGSAFTLAIGNYESKKINQKKKKMFEKRTKLVRMIRSIFEGTESYLTNWQYLSMVQRYEKENRVYIKEIEQVASQKARRGNWIRWVDGSVYLLLIILCYVLVKEESIRIVITMVSVYSTMKSYMNRLNDYVSYVIENMYVIEKYQEIQNDKKRKQEHTQQYIFEVKNLSYVVSGHKILESINFQMEDKKKIALIGKNGSGKSTFMKILLSVLSPTEGEVRRNQIKSYSYVPVKAQLFPVAIEENIMYGSAEKTGISLKKIMEAARLNIMGEERLKRVLPEGEEDLSGGEAQRVAIARAMAAQADVLIADEPTASLDIVTSEKVFENLIRTSPSVLFTTHNPKLLRYADEIYIMEKGRIVYSGTYEEVCKTEAYQKWKYEMNV